MTDKILMTSNFVDSCVANVVQINTVTILQAQVVQKGVTRGGGVLLGILGGGVPAGSPNPDLISDQRCNFPHPFSD